MRLVLLKAKTAHGKNRLHEAAIAMPEWPGEWEVLEERELVPAFTGRGPFLFVAPVAAEPRSRDRFSRWVAAHNDKHFDVCPNAELSGPRPLAAEGSRSNAGLGNGGNDGQ